MPDEKLVTSLLSQADEAAAIKDWATVKARAENVFRFDPENIRAKGLLELPEVLTLVRMERSEVEAERARKTKRLLRERSNDPESDEAQDDLIVGTLVTGAGGLASLALYAAASADPAGGTYIVFWGAMVYGGFRLIKGLWFYLWKFLE